MNIRADEKDEGLRWLFVDMNAFFASCEQADNPALRGKPIAVVPMLAENTCAIAASYEAKAYGIKTGTLVREARALCPSVIFIPARPKLYVETHHRFLAAIERCLPVEDVLSVDEVACRLDRTERNADAARALARRIKAAMREDLGPALTCSIGIASNTLLAKLASDMQKPDGLTILRPRDLPEALLGLKPQDICGIGPRMAARLAAHGIADMEELWSADAARLRRVWGGVTGARFHALLHGADLPAPASLRGSLGHQHVLPPHERTMEKATPVIRQLLTRAALRLREEKFYCRRLVLEIKWARHLGGHVDEIRFRETLATEALMDALMRLWQRAPALPPWRIGVTLADLVPASAHQYDLFDRPKNEALTRALDRINDKYGRGTIALGNSGTIIRSKISFHRVPTLAEV